MTDAVRIRSATPADADVIVDFNCRLAFETESKDLHIATVRRGVTGMFQRPERGRYYVAEVGGEIVGQIMVTTEWSDWRDGDIWWIQSVYVRSDHRRRGIYRRLHDHVRQTARSMPGVVGIRLYVEEHNQNAQAVYAKVGLTSEGYIVLGEIWPTDGDVSSLRRQ